MLLLFLRRLHAATPCAPPPPSCDAATRLVVVAGLKSSMAPCASRVLLPQPPSATAPPLGESGLPLIWCPYCGKGRILELMSNTAEHSRERFFKCPRKYKQFARCDFYMFEEEYANFLVHYGMLEESEMCHYRPLETTDGAEAEVYEQALALMNKEPARVYGHRRTVHSAKKGGTKKQKHKNWMMCVGVVVLVLLGFNSAILLMLVVMQMYK